MLSKVFPATHPRAGQPTDFREKFLAAINRDPIEWLKKHTMRKRFEQIDKGEACLSVRQWTGKPYRSKQFELARLTREDGIGLQKLSFDKDRDGCILFNYFDIDGRFANIEDVANNDGLSFSDWREWFKDYDFSKPLAIIQFTKFRY